MHTSNPDGKYIVRQTSKRLGLHERVMSAPNTIIWFNWSSLHI